MHRGLTLLPNEPHRVDRDGIESPELRYAATHTTPAGEAFRARARGVYGADYEVEMVFFPAAGRAGIAWREEVWWLDAPSPVEALLRWIRGEGRTNSSRRRGTRPVVAL